MHASLNSEIKWGSGKETEKQLKKSMVIQQNWSQVQVIQFGRGIESPQLSLCQSETVGCASQTVNVT